jgi:hypothetical protein
LVYHKKQIIQKQWKDVGAGQSVLMVLPVITSNSSFIASEAKQSSDFKKVTTSHPEQATCHPEQATCHPEHCEGSRDITMNK